VCPAHFFLGSLTHSLTHSLPDMITDNDDNEPGVLVSGSFMTVSQLAALAESLESERPHLFGFVRAFRSSPAEMTTLFRQVIRADYERHAQEAVEQAREPSAPSLECLMQQQEQEQEEEEEMVFVELEDLPQPPASRSVSLQESLELAQRLEAEEEAREQEEVRVLAEALADEDRRRAQFFQCEICLDDEVSIHGAFTLDCDHRFCEG
jgi:hypothetical protein